MGGSEADQTEYVTQIPGTAVRLGADPLLREFDSSKPFRDLLLRYTQAYIAQRIKLTTFAEAPSIGEAAGDVALRGVLASPG